MTHPENDENDIVYELEPARKKQVSVKQPIFFPFQACLIENVVIVVILDRVIETYVFSLWDMLGWSLNCRKWTMEPPSITHVKLMWWINSW